MIAAFSKGKSQNTKTFQASVCIAFADVPLAKGSHVDNPGLSVGGGYTRVREVLFSGSLALFMHNLSAA